MDQFGCNQQRLQMQEINMNEFIAALGVVYACNLLSEQGPVSADLAFQCVRAHEAVKLRFLTAEEVAQLSRLSLREQNVIKLRGYRRYKAWEDDNPDIIRRIRDIQRERLTPDKSVPLY